MSDPHGLQLLLAQALAGDGGAAAELTGKLRGWVRLQARHVVGDQFGAKLDASDIAQEVCLRVGKKFSQFEGRTVPELLGWINAIMRNFIIGRNEYYHEAQKRGAAREVPGSKVFAFLAASGSSPERRAIRDDEAVRLAAAIQQLPDRKREVVQLHYFDGLPYKEIASRMRCSTASLRILCHRAILDLRRITESVNDDSQ
jgi:RNA polymerase sigma-70 factor (ECF subfamily)